MEKYDLLLINERDGRYNELMLKDIIGSRVPLEGETILTKKLTDYIIKVAEESNVYATYFTNSSFLVSKVEHIPIYGESKIEKFATTKVIATKL